MSYPKSKVMIGCLYGERSLFPRTLEQAFGNGPAITYQHMRRRDRTDWGGNWAPNSHTPPGGWFRVIVGAAATVAVIVAMLFVGHGAGF